MPLPYDSEVDSGMSKIVTIDELAGLKREGQTLVHCHGVFDLLHPGHLRHLLAAKREGDILVVTITPDQYVNRGPNRPAFSEQLRAEQVAALECVDYVAINRWPTAVETIKLLKPDIYVKGSDYSNQESDITGGIIAEEEAVKEVGGRIHFTDEITFSSSELINRYFNPYSGEASDFLDSLRQRFSANEVIDQIQGLRGIKALVIGEYIIDRYIYVTPLGKSPKESLIPVRYESEKEYEGGGAVVANQIREFCDIVSYQPPRPVIKVRYIDPTFFTKLFEYQVFPDRMEYRLDPEGEFDLVIVCDFGHGLFDDKLKENVYKANFLALNVQTNSANVGFNLIAKYKRADFFCIDEPELRLVYHDKDTEMEALTERLASDLGCKKGVVTLGHKGSMVYSGGEIYHIPVLTKEVKDRMGAGDAYYALASICAFNDFSPELIGFLGSALAALKVGVIGNEIIGRTPFLKFITTLLK